MKRWLLTLTFIVSFSLSAAAGFWFGFREAWHLGVAAEFIPRGVIATYQLKVLSAGKPENVIVGLENDVDVGLLFGRELFEHPLHKFLNPIWGFAVYPEFEQYAIRLADYRKEHPSLMKPDMFDIVPPGKEQYRESYKEMAQGARENTATINAMVEKYATKR